MNSTNYKQYDSRWGNLPYPNRPWTIANSGCGEVAICNIIIEMEKYKNETPKTIQPYCVQYAAPGGDGTYWSGIPAMMKHYGLTEVKEHDTMPELFAELAKGNRVAVYLMGSRSAGSKGVHWTSGGHFVSSVAYKKEGGEDWVYMKDPNSTSSLRNGWITYNGNIRGACLKVWSGKLSGSPAPTPTPPSGDHYTGEYPNPTKYLEKGDRGSEVTKLQNYLNWYTDGKFFKACGGADGIYGNNTLKYVKQMQTDFFGAKEADGMVGQKTIAKMKAYSKGDKPKPTPTTKSKVIDVSAVQSSINWAKVKVAGIDGAMIRCGYRGYESAKLNEDSMFLDHIKGASKAGLKVGVYFFTEAINAKEGKEEAEYTLKLIEKAGVKLYYPIAVDTEAQSAPTERAKNLTKAQRTAAIKGFCEGIKARGGDPMIYASTSWFENKLDMSKLPYKVWCAQYYKECQYKGTVSMWQYTSEGSVNGVKGVVDMNECYITKASPMPTPTPKPTGKAYTGKYPRVDRVKILIDEAVRLSWPSGTPKSKYAWRGGSARASFTEALDKVYPEHNSWGPAPSKGCSCDVFVGTVVRSSGIDPKFPRGLDEQEGYTPKGMFKRVLGGADMYKQSIYGDIIWYDYPGPGGHILIRGKDCLYQAGYQSTYGHVTDGLDEIKDTEPKVIIFRPRNYLEKGDTGVDITRLQKYLNWYTDGEFFKKCGEADGIYGANTLKYVKKMQTAFFGKSEADGLVGAKTIAKMKAVRK